MKIRIFYSWQNSYKDNCDKIIRKALQKAVDTLNKKKHNIQYIILRGGGGTLGSEPIDENVKNTIKIEADLGLVDFTHVGISPQQDVNTGEWKKERCSPNTNVVYEYGRLVATLNERQVFKVYNTAYGDLKTNLEMPFDFRQEHFPLDFFCSDETSEEQRQNICETLANRFKSLILKGTEEFFQNQKIRYAPLVPLRYEFDKAMYQSLFVSTDAFETIKTKIDSGKSIRLVGLPGLGKTRMMVEAFRNLDENAYYCDCREKSKSNIISAVESLLGQKDKAKQVVILDNCDQGLCTKVLDLINQYGFLCQLITIYYDPSECPDSGVELFTLRVEDATPVVKSLVNNEATMLEDVKHTLIEMAGGFPLMATMMISNYRKGESFVNVQKGDVFERMLGINPNNANDSDKLKVLTAFSIFKFIGLYGRQEKQGRFIAGNRIITNIRGSEEDKFLLFKEVHGEYQQLEILERQGNLVLMRLIPLAIYLCRIWFQRQTTDSIAELIRNICDCSDEGTRNMIMESLSRRITLLNEIPLARELKSGLTDPDTSPFLTEEVVLSSLGSRLFLAFSEVNPESSALALYRIIVGKSDAEIQAMDSARRNLISALNHLAFDHRSFRNAMLCLARFSLVETEEHLSNNSTGVFVDRFAILLSGTEVDLQERLQVLEELLKDSRYEKLVMKALLSGFRTGSFYRTGGAEKQGTRKLADYVPSYREIVSYYSGCLKMIISLVKSPSDVENLAKTLASNARRYYLNGAESFLLSCLEKVAPMKNYVWEEMREVLSFILMYDADKRNRFLFDEIETWKSRLTKDDYVYRFFHCKKEIAENYRLSIEENIKKTRELYEVLARELVDDKLYHDNSVMSAIFAGKCFYFSTYGMELSSYSKKQGVQGELLDAILGYVLNEGDSCESENILLYYLVHVEDEYLLQHVYHTILHSEKKYLLVAAYAIKAEGEDKQNQLFELVEKGDLSISNFTSYFNFLNQIDQGGKKMIRRLLDYGSEGAAVVLTHCYQLLFEENLKDEDCLNLVRLCLLKIDMDTFRMNELLYFENVSLYLTIKHDEELALHVQSLFEIYLRESQGSCLYYMEWLYQKVLFEFSDLLKNPLLKLLEDELCNDKCIKTLQTSFPSDDTKPIYKFISDEEWFDWINEDEGTERVYVAALMFSFSEGDLANPVYLRLIDNYWCDNVRDALNYRLHTCSWIGSAIPLCQSRISICEDYIGKLSNNEAKEWFKNDIDYWKNEIAHELIKNAHCRAIYD